MRRPHARTKSSPRSLTMRRPHARTKSSPRCPQPEKAYTAKRLSTHTHKTQPLTQTRWNGTEKTQNSLPRICNLFITLQLFKYKFFLKTVNSTLRVLTLERGVAGSPQSRNPSSPPSGPPAVSHQPGSRRGQWQ